jgi:hypothetical protein
MAGLRICSGVLAGVLAVWSPAALAEGPAPHTARAKPASAQKTRSGKVTHSPKRAHGKSTKWVHRDDAAGVPRSPGVINESISITPFPSQAAATKRALAQNRRDMLVDAEKAARGSSVDDRWQTVLFSLRDIDARSDPEGCFWRLVAYYRLGQIERAREIRDKCELPQRDLSMLEAEDAQAASLQPPMAMAEKDHAPAPVANPAPYSGASPTRIDR